MDLRTAVDTANNAIRQLYPPDMLEDLLLEEVERREVSPSRSYWYVTLGFDRIRRNTEETAGILPKRVDYRTYKQFQIDDESGEVLAMRDRELID